MTRPDDLHRFGLEIYLEQGTAPSATACIPVFHQWIREGALDGLLLDVADYRHLSDGPQLLLVGHEGNLALDESNGRSGLLYTAKRVPGDSFGARLSQVARRLLTAARRLEEDETLTPSPRFDSGRIELISNDRLAAPTDEDAAAALRPALERLGTRLHPDTGHELDAPPGPPGARLRLALSSRARSPLSVLLERLGAPEPS